MINFILCYLMATGVFGSIIYDYFKLAYPGYSQWHYFRAALFYGLIWPAAPWFVRINRSENP